MMCQHCLDHVEIRLHPSILMRQVIDQVGRFINILVRAEGISSTHPLHVPEDATPLPKRCRRDVILGDTLAMGQGCGIETEMATNIAQHIQSYEMFTPMAKRQKTMDIREINASLGLRYVQTQEAFFHTVRFPSISSDGCRLSTKDVQYLCFGGRADGSSKYLTGWDLKVTCPPTPPDPPWGRFWWFGKSWGPPLK